jgi:hypothetical protein
MASLTDLIYSSSSSIRWSEGVISKISSLFAENAAKAIAAAVFLGEASTIC